MAQACDPSSLVAGAACLECGIPSGMQLPVLISLFCKIAGMNCDPATLIANAACLECGIPPGMQMAVLNYLACQIANAPTVQKFTSANLPLDNVTTKYAANHGLGATPRIIQARLVAVAFDGNLNVNVGDEIEIDCVSGMNTSSGATVGQAFILGANSTQVYVETGIEPVLASPLVGNEVFYGVLQKATTMGFASPASWANFAFRLCAWL